MRIAGLGNLVKALRNRNYGIYTAGNTASQIGDWMQRLGVGWLAWELTHSAAWLGAIAFADLFPSALIGPISGAFADRWNRLAIAKIAQVLAFIQASTLFVLTFTGVITIEILFALTFALGAITAFVQPARLSLIPSLVGPDQVTTAVAINSVIFNVARFVGPAIAGIVLVSGGTSLVFAANALTFLWFLVALQRIRLERDDRSSIVRDTSIFGDFVAGVRYAARHRGIAPMCLLLLIVCMFARPYAELLPGFAALFGHGADALALMTSSIGLGAICAGLWLTSRTGVEGLTAITMTSALALVGAILWFLASPNLMVAVPALFIGGGSMVVVGIGAQTLLQMAVDSDMRGRILGLYGMIFRVGPAVGALMMGWASEYMGLRMPLALGMIAVLAAWAWLAMRQRQVADALEHATPQV